MRLLTVSSGKCSNKNPLPLERIVAILGFEDAVEALGSVHDHNAAIRLFACYCAEYSLKYFERKHPDDKRPREAIETAERFAFSRATKEELSAAKYAAEAVVNCITTKALPESNPNNHILIGGPDLKAARAAAFCAAANIAVDVTYCVFNAVRAAADTGKVYTRYERKFCWRSQFEMEYAHGAVLAYFAREFIRLCRLEGEYGEVDKQDNLITNKKSFVGLSEEAKKYLDRPRVVNIPPEKMHLVIE